MLGRIIFRVNRVKMVIFTICGSLIGAVVGGMAGLLYGVLRTPLEREAIITDVVAGAAVGTAAGITTGAILAALTSSRSRVDPWPHAIVDANGDLVPVERLTRVDRQPLLTLPDEAPTHNENRLTAIKFDLFEVPNEFCDPITKRIFQRPVKTTLGQTYEESSIPLLQGKCALTRLLFDPNILNPNEEMALAVESFIQAQEEAFRKKIQEHSITIHQLENNITTSANKI